MAHKAETTFGDLQMDERFKKLERSLKLALLKREHNKNTHNGEASPVPTWPSISSINTDTLDSSYVFPSLQISRVGSEVLASSANLRNMFPAKKNYNANREAMATSSVRQYNVKQDSRMDRCIMPPPMTDRVSRAKKISGGSRMLLDYEKPVSTPLNDSIQSTAITNCSSRIAPNHVSVNINNNEKYLHPFATPVTPVNNFQKVDRVFSKWKVMLNDQQQLIIKGVLECGKVARSKPILKRCTATCVESIYKHKYGLQGNIDERNELPDYICGKFYNGFPDDWENVCQIWGTFVRQGCPVTFRWPTPVTDSDDDLNSELTDLTYVNAASDKLNTTGSYESTRFARQLINHEGLNDKSSGKMEKCLNCVHGLQNNEKEHSFVKSSFPNVREDLLKVQKIYIAPTENDEDSRQSIETNVNTVCSSGRTNKLTNILQEDKLNIIINNLSDKNCSPKYIEKIFEMFDCLEYLVSYKSGLERNSGTMFPVKSCDMSKLEATPLQQVLTCDKENRANQPNQPESIMESKSHVHSFDLGYGSIKIDSNPSQLRHARDIESEYDDRKDPDKSESEVYTGIPKILMERVLQAKQGAEKTFKHKTRKRMVRSGTRKYEYSDQDVASVSGESNNNPLDKSRVSRDLHKGCMEQAEREAAMTRSKPIITSLIPVNLNIKVSNRDSQRSTRLHDSDISIVENEEQCSSIRFPEEFREEKPVSKISTSIKPTVVNNSHLKATVDSNKDNYTMSNTVHNKKAESDNTNSASCTKSTTNSDRQSRSNKLEAGNPKLLTAWMPKVVYNSKSKTELGLVFQGKLLNEVGHVVHRKFTTDIVLKRLSTTLIETVNHEFYQLLGCLNDKHVIPKELVKKFRHGCPAKIEEFCSVWKSLQHAEVRKVEKLHDASVNFLNVPVSSKGRKILPPLSYWTGERVTLKDNTPVYNLGNSQKSSLASLNESPNKDTEEKRKQRIYHKSVSKYGDTPNKQKPLCKTNEISSIKKDQMTVIEKDQSLNKSRSIKAADSTKTLNNMKRYRQAAIDSKRKIAQQLFSSTDSSQEEQDVSPRKRIRSSRSNTSAGAKASSKSSMKQRKRRKLEISPNKVSHRDANKPKYDTTHCPSTKNSRRNLMYAYYQGIQLPQDLLSEEQVSPM